MLYLVYDKLIMFKTLFFQPPYLSTGGAPSKSDLGVIVFKLSSSLGACLDSQQGANLTGPGSKRVSCSIGFVTSERI